MRNVFSNSDSAISRLEGLIPVTEDWHAKMCLYKVCVLALGVVHVSMCVCACVCMCVCVCVCVCVSVRACVCVCVWSKDGISYGNQVDVYIIIRGVWGAGNVICKCI